MKKIIITGAAGFIGSHAVDRFLKDGYTVVGVDNLSTGLEKNILHNINNPNFKFYEADIKNYLAVFEIFCFEKNIDIVLHCAANAILTKSVKEPAYDASTNIIGSLNIIEECAQRHCKLIYLSSGGCSYKDLIENVPYNEDSPKEQINPYAISKFTVEKYINFYNKEKGLNSITLRLGNVFGPRQRSDLEAGVISIFIEQLIRGEAVTLYGMGIAIRDYVYVTDVVNAVAKAFNYGGVKYCDVFNIANGVGIKNRMLYDSIQRIIVVDKNKYKYPILKPLRPGEINTSILSIERAREMLGWIPEVSLEGGIKKTVEWYINGNR